MILSPETGCSQMFFINPDLLKLGEAEQLRWQKHAKHKMFPVLNSMKQNWGWKRSFRFRPSDLLTNPNTNPNIIAEQILSLIRADSQITKKRLAEKLGLSIEGIRYHTNILKKTGKLRFIGSSKKGYWEIIENEH